jgi:ribosomal protein S18 acetylase RimI-like enzyme/nitroimidazol reductase NimA-like FMN-containing flavoprotein (pyridoxamine 5'-phosphate oxidase superfamily)
MRHAHYELARDEALALLAAAEFVQVATLTPDGKPLLRALHAVVFEGAIWFHASPDGEKASSIGQLAVAGAERVITSIPSYFIDPLRACPATTYYESVQAHGRLSRVEDRAGKARMLQAFMGKYQPEAGFAPIEPDSRFYANMLDYLLIGRIEIERLEGKRKLGQNRSSKQLAGVLEGLWRRGAPGDDRAIEALLAANPSLLVPEFLRGPDALRLHCALEARHVEAAVELVAGEYWNHGMSRETLAKAHLGASAWVGATDSQGRLLATARAVSDGAKFAYVADVAVARDRRGRGLGKALLSLLLDHPSVRHVRGVRLGTADAMELYRGFGFVETSSIQRPYRSVDMLLVR